MIYNFPPVRWVEINTPYKQVNHMDSEMAEVFDALCNGHIEDVDAEVMDLYHSCETYLRIRERMGADMQAVYRQTLDKNHDRGYYDADNNNS